MEINWIFAKYYTKTLQNNFILTKISLTAINNTDYVKMKIGHLFTCRAFWHVQTDVSLKNSGLKLAAKKSRAVLLISYYYLGSAYKQLQRHSI